MKMDPHNKHGWSKLAGMAIRLGRHDKALECANRALALDEEFVEAYLHKGAAAKALGKTLYQTKDDLLSDYLRAELSAPRIQAFMPA